MGKNAPNIYVFLQHRNATKDNLPKFDGTDGVIHDSPNKSNLILFVTYTWLADVNASVAKCLCF